MSRLDTVEGAIEFATRAHDGQVDKQGRPYILHPLRVGARLHEFGDTYVITGLLHDVVEDTFHSLDDLSSLGADPSIIAALDLLTRKDKHEPYVDYILRTCTSDLAGWVKASDVADNYGRLKGLEAEEGKRLYKKYINAIFVLEMNGYHAALFL